MILYIYLYHLCISSWASILRYINL